MKFTNSVTAMTFISFISLTCLLDDDKNYWSDDSDTETREYQVTLYCSSKVVVIKAAIAALTVAHNLP